MACAAFENPGNIFIPANRLAVHRYDHIAFLQPGLFCRINTALFGFHGIHSNNHNAVGVKPQAKWRPTRNHVAALRYRNMRILDGKEIQQLYLNIIALLLSGHIVALQMQLCLRGLILRSGNA